jgi:transposase-like protein
MEIENVFNAEADCVQYLETIRWNGKVISPFDPESKVYKCANNRYRCRNTGKYFNVKTGTIFEDTKIPLVKWFKAIVLSKEIDSISSYELAKRIGISQKTAWSLSQVLKKAGNNLEYF